MSAIVASIQRLEGRSIIFRSAPAVNLLALISFTDDATPPSGGQQFIKTFRYTLDGVNYSNWQELTVPNLSAITVGEDDIFVAEMSYFKDQPADSDYLQVSSISINTSVGAEIDKFYFDNSIFKKYFNSDDTDVLIWFVNVLEKLYFKGLIPNFIKRKDESGSSEDFLALFGSITRFFAFYVKYARVFAAFYENEELIKDFLNQRGLNTSPEDTLEELQHYLETYYYQMSHRGTLGIVDLKRDGAEYNGELLRLIHFKEFDEFIFCHYRKQNFGWNLGNSSPLYRGLSINDNINKTPWSKGRVDMQNTTQYVTFGSGNIETNDFNKKALVFASSGTWNMTTPIPVDPKIDYEISFRILTADPFTFTVRGFDYLGVAVNNFLRKTGAFGTVVLSNAKLSRDDKYITVRVILYNKAATSTATDTTNLKQGSNVIAAFNLNNITLKLDVTGYAEIFDFKVMPVRTEYSRGFIQVNNFISTWVRNRNSKYNTQELEDYIRRYLIPYNCHLKVTSIEEIVAVHEFGWRGREETAYCELVEEEDTQIFETPQFVNIFV